MTTSNTITKNDFKSIFENINLATFAYGRGEVGEIKAYGGSTIPAGWLLCNGQAVSRTTYPELFSVIGTTYGSGDGSTTFNVPDLRGNVTVGASTTLTLGDTGGEATHTLDIDEMPSHTHIQNSHNHTQNAHGHSMGVSWTSSSSGGQSVTFYGEHRNDTNPAGNVISNTTATNIGTTATNQNTGGDKAHNNMQPYVVVNYIIYAKNTVTMANPSLDLFYPVGSYYETSDSTFDPNVQWGGTWVLETAGQVHVSSGTGYTINGALTNTTDGGASTVSLQTTNLPAHTHALFGNDYPGSTDPSSSSIINRYATSGYTDLPYSVRPTQTVTTANVGKSGSTGSGTAHNNMQPYIVVNRWHRTA